MKRIQFRRHSIKQGPGDTDLSDQGLHLAHQVGKDCLRGKKFSRIFVSSLKRTHDTAIEFMRGAGDFSPPSLELFRPGIEVGGTEDALRLWSGACNAAERAGKDMLQAALQYEPSMTQDIASKSALAFKTWIDSLPDGKDALVIGHSPFLELMAYGLFGRILPQLQYCEGFMIIEDHGTLRYESLE